MLARERIPNLLTYARLAAVPLCLAIMLLNPAWKAWGLLFLFFFAALTDYLDGYLARKWNVVSPIGTLLDPVADKLLVALMLVYLLIEGIPLPSLSSFADSRLVLEGYAPTLSAASGSSISPLFLPVVVILLRELYISGLREFLAYRQIKLPVSNGGKWKTAMQMIAISLLLAALALATFAETLPATASPLFCAAPFAAAFSHLCDVEPLVATAVDAWVGIIGLVGICLLYLSALLALTSAISYTRVAATHLR
jgi:cardiolipin synthase